MHLLKYAHVLNAHGCMMQFMMFLHPLHVNSTSTWFINNCIFLLFPHLKHVDIVLSKEGVCAFIEVIIVDPTLSNFLCQTNFPHDFIILEIAQMKELGLTSVKSIYPIGNKKDRIVQANGF